MFTISTTLDVLYLSLAVGFIVLVIFLSITLLYSIFILRDVSKVTEDVKAITYKVNEYIVSPIKMANTIVSHIKPIVDAVQEKGRKARKKKDEDDE